MKRTRFSEEQIIGVLREHEAGAATADVCRKHGISSATFYKWKAKYGGLEVSDAKRLRSLEDENRRLQKLLAEAMLEDLHWLRDYFWGKNMVGTPRFALVRDNQLIRTDFGIYSWTAKMWPTIQKEVSKTL